MCSGLCRARRRRFQSCVTLRGSSDCCSAPRGVQSGAGWPVNNPVGLLTNLLEHSGNHKIGDNPPLCKPTTHQKKKETARRGHTAGRTWPTARPHKDVCWLCWLVPNASRLFGTSCPSPIVISFPPVARHATIRDRTLGGGALGESELLRKKGSHFARTATPCDTATVRCCESRPSRILPISQSPPARVCPREDERRRGDAPCSRGLAGSCHQLRSVLTLPLLRTTVYLPMDAGESGALPVTQHPGGSGTHFRTVRGPTAPHNVLNEPSHLRSPPLTSTVTSHHHHHHDPSAPKCRPPMRTPARDLDLTHRIKSARRRFPCRVGSPGGRRILQLRVFGCDGNPAGPSRRSRQSSHDLKSSRGRVEECRVGRLSTRNPLLRFRRACRPRDRRKRGATCPARRGQPASQHCNADRPRETGAASWSKKSNPSSVGGSHGIPRLSTISRRGVNASEQRASRVEPEFLPPAPKPAEGTPAAGLMCTSRRLA